MSVREKQTYLIIIFIVVPLLWLISWTIEARLHTYSPYDGTAQSVAEHPVAVSFQEGVTLLGWSAESGIPSDHPIDIKLFWKAAATLTFNYGASIALIDEEWNQIALSDLWHIAYSLSEAWTTDGYVRDLRALIIDPAHPPGEYRLIVSTYHDDGTSRRHLNVVGADGSIGAQFIEIGRITLARPEQVVEEIQSANPVDYVVSNAIHLVGYSLHQYDVTAGDTFHFSTHWRAIAEPIAGNNFQLWLRDVDGDGQVILVGDAPFVTAYPTDKWQIDDVWVGYHAFPIAEDVPAGRYEVLVGIDLSNALHTIGVINVAVQ